MCSTCNDLRAVLADAERNADKDPETFKVAQDAYCWHVCECEECEKTAEAIAA